MKSLEDGGYHHETNLPTQKETEKQSARIPQENEHKIGQERFEAPSQSRPQETLRVSMKRQVRLKRRASFMYVFRKGERTSSPDLTLIAARSREGLKIGLSVSKRVGNAVTRNRVKRLLREAIRPLEDSIAKSYLYVIVAAPSLAQRDFGEVSRQVRQVFERAGRLRV